jgi:hypothetical protein
MFWNTRYKRRWLGIMLCLETAISETYLEYRGSRIFWNVDKIVSEYQASHLTRQLNYYRSTEKYKLQRWGSMFFRIFIVRTQKAISSFSWSKAIPVQAHTVPGGWGSQIQDNRHINVARLSALRTGSLYPSRNYSWYTFLLEAESTEGP